MDAVLEALGYKTPSKAKAAPSAQSATPDVPGGPLMAQSPQTRADVLADAAKTGQPFTFNGMPPEGGGGPQAPANDPVLGVLGYGKPYQPNAPVAAPTAAPATAPVAPPGMLATAASFLPNEAVGRYLAGQASGLAGTVVGGYRGLSTLAQGGSLDDAANTVRKTQDDWTYQPPAGTGGAVLTSMGASPYNPQNWPAMAAEAGGGRIADAGMPALGAAVTGVGTVAPMLLGIRSVKPMSSLARGAPEVVGAPAPASLAPAGRGAPSVGGPALSTPPAATVPTGAVPAAGGRALANAEVLRRVGIAPEDMRVSALVEDQNRANTVQNAAKGTDAAGQLLKAKLDAEKTALDDHAQGIIADTGGTLGTDGASLANRGQTIATAFDGLRNYFADQRKALYAAADTEAGNSPNVQLNGLKSMLDTDSTFQGKAANGSLRQGIQAYLKEQGIQNADGTMNAITPRQAEGVRQYINSQFSHETSGLAGKIKGSIDEDVFGQAGSDIYARARQLVAQEHATLDNPNGVSKLFDTDPNTPINRATPFEKIPDTITQLPKAQLGHVMETLNSMKDLSPELAQQAAAAKAEIQAQFINRLRDKGLLKDANGAGQWNARSVSQEANANSGRYPLVFDDPAVLSKVNDLTKAGEILRIKGGYPGAHMQASNLANMGLNAMPTAGAAVGGTVGGFVGAPGAGAALGGMAGRAIAGGLATKSAVSRAGKEYGLKNLANPP